MKSAKTGVFFKGSSIRGVENTPTNSTKNVVSPRIFLMPVLVLTFLHIFPGKYRLFGGGTVFFNNNGENREKKMKSLS